MKSKNALTYVAIGIVVVVIGGLFIIKRQGSPPLDGLAQCIKILEPYFTARFGPALPKSKILWPIGKISTLRRMLDT